MLAERVKEWTKEWENQGMQKGMQKGLQKGLQKGRKEGMQEGKQKGEAALLLKQVELKFGVQDETIRARISSATSKQLTKWGEKILSASSIQEMFGKK